MEDIRFYTFNFEPVYILSDGISVNWMLYYNDVGTFELHVIPDGAFIKMLHEHPYLVAVQGNKQAIITGRRIHKECTLYGRTCNWLLSRRITPHCEPICGTAEALAQGFVSEAFSDTEVLEIGETVGFEKELTVSVSHPRSTLQVVKGCFLSDHGGHMLRFMPGRRRWIFQALRGRTLPLTICESNLNAYDMTYAEDMLEYYNGGWYQASDEDGERVYIADESMAQGIYRWECELFGESRQEAEQDLKEKRRRAETETKVYNLVYGQDYELGDVVYMKSEQDLFTYETRQRIIGVHLWYEGTGSGEEPIFEEVQDGVSG